MVNSRRTSDTEIAGIRTLLDAVKDPEIPVLSIHDLGVLREVELMGNKVIVKITPTYSGCPAMELIRDDIRKVLANAGYDDVDVVSVLSPAWTTDWMSAAGKQKLREYGIAPPRHSKDADVGVSCPRCATENARLISEYGSTACKAMYQCEQCKETFCYFKVI